jgi:hypothetical protein
VNSGEARLIVVKRATQILRSTLTACSDFRALSISPDGATVTTDTFGTGVESEQTPPTSILLFDQGLLQVLQASATGLEPKQPYVLARSLHRDGSGVLEPPVAFTTNPAASAIVNAVGPIRQVVRGEHSVQPRYLVIAPGTAHEHGAPVQIQAN